MKNFYLYFCCIIFIFINYLTFAFESLQKKRFVYHKILSGQLKGYVTTITTPAGTHDEVYIFKVNSH